MATITFYPEPNVATTAGCVTIRANSSVSWAAARALTTGAREFVTQATYVEGELNASLFRISRSILTFNTAALGSSATISSAVFSIHSVINGGASTETANPANPALVGATPSNTTTFSDTDFAQLGLVRFADTDVPLSTWRATDNYVNWTLNASGIAAIDKVGVTKLGIRQSNDFSDATAPTLLSSGTGLSAEQSGALADPKLVVTYNAVGEISANQTLPAFAQTATLQTVDGLLEITANQNLISFSQTATLEATPPPAGAGYRYYRFRQTKLRATANSIQLAEFAMLNAGVRTAVVAITNPGGNFPAGEAPTNANDNNTATKWLDFNKLTLVYDYGSPVPMNSYYFTTANDAPERDPVRWAVEGSNDNTAWTMLSDKTLVDYPTPTARLTQTETFTFDVVAVADPEYPAFLLLM